MQCFLLAPIDPHICDHLALSFLPTEPPAAISGSVKYYLTDIQSEMVCRNPEWRICANISNTNFTTLPMSNEPEIAEIIDYFGIAHPFAVPFFSEKDVIDIFLEPSPSGSRQKDNISCIIENTYAETKYVRPLYGFIARAICRQSVGETLILKLSDTFTWATIDILAILSAFYTTVHLVKPASANIMGSNKYVVCQEFIGASSEYKKRLMAFLLEIEETCVTQYVSRLLAVDAPMNFVSSVEICNIMMGKCQIENIHNILLNLDKTAPSAPTPGDSRYDGSGESRGWNSSPRTPVNPGRIGENTEWTTSKTYFEASPKIRYGRKTRSHFYSR